MRGQTTPAVAVNMSVSVIGRQVAVSPRHMGAGQMLFSIANTNGRAETLVARPTGGHGLRAVLGTIPAGGSSQIKIDLRPGRYLIGSPSTGETAIVMGHRALKPATLVVGRPRPGGDSAVEQP
jgi:hypothetical protein